MTQKGQTKNTSEIAKVERKQKKQQQLLNTMEKRERWMKWVIIGLMILVLLLILFLGYATDWTKGLRKDAVTDTNTSLDSAKTLNDTDATGESTNNGANGTNGTNGANGNTGTNTTNRESSTSTTTNNTTNNNSTTPSSSTTLSEELLKLYQGISVGDNISEATDTVPNLVGVSQECRNEILIQVCEFRDGESVITTRNLLGTGIITSITKNF